MESLFFLRNTASKFTVLLVNKELYLEKFKTSVRARPYQSQQLGMEFYKKEHTEPFVYENQMMAYHNLYNYQLLNCTYKILKFRTSIAIYSCFNLSNRKEKQKTLCIYSKGLPNYFKV